MPNKTNTPPGGWVYQVPETGKRIGPFSGARQLHDVLRGHYQSAGYDFPGDIMDKVEAQICENQPEYCSEPPRGVIGRAWDSLKNMGHTFNAARQCLVTLVSNRAGSGERPSQELRELRARTCVECPMNQEITPCSHCRMDTLNSLVTKLSGATKTSYDSQLKFCAVCHCNLRAKIATKHEAIWNHIPKEQKERLPQNCWLISEAHGNL